MTINEMKQYSKNLEMTPESYNDIQKRAKNAGYTLALKREHFHNTCECGGYWLHQTDMWVNHEKNIKVIINWATWSWGSDHPKKYDFNGHIMTDDELYCRA